MSEKTLARGMGWLSLGVGLVLVAAPHTVGRTFGVDNRPALLRALGVRDLFIGAGMLQTGNTLAWMRARTLADASDTALMTAGTLSGEFARKRALAGLLAAFGVCLFDFLLTHRLQQAAG